MDTIVPTQPRSAEGLSTSMRFLDALKVKVMPPTAGAVQIPREALCERIGASSAKVVLVRAPAGFGKTSLLTQCFRMLEAHGVTCAWLTLDRSDNDASRFHHNLTKAVARLGLDARVDPISALGAWQGPFALFLDDLETVYEPTVLGWLREVIDQLPHGCRVVIGSRNLPALGLARLRARGQLCEIDTEDLRFDLRETDSFFGQRSVTRLSIDLLDQLRRKTEGWIAGLWLASMALERSHDAAEFIERFSGSDVGVAGYLAEDVLASQPEDVRDFLLRTSILRQLDAPTCQALCPRTDCERMLERLDAMNLFITPLAGKTRAWRYHSLFADFLRTQLVRERPDDVMRLHLAASGWYESQGRIVQAIDHAIEGGDFPQAVTLLDNYAEPYLEQGRMRMLARWFAALPPALLDEHPFLQVMALWATGFTQGPWVTMQRLETSRCATSDDPGVRANVAALRPLLLAMQDRYEEALEAGRGAMTALPTGKPFADSLLLNVTANVLVTLGEQREAQRLLDEARREQGSSPFNRMYIESSEGLLDLYGGRMRQASARFQLALDATRQASYPHSHGNAWAGVLFACALYEADKLEQADRLLNVYLPLARDIGLPDHMIMTHVARSRIAFVTGDVESALLLLTELEYVGHLRQLPRVVASAKLERARVLLLQGNGTASLDELRRANDEAVWERERDRRLPAHDLDYYALARLRWELAFGDVHSALPLIEREMAVAEAAQRYRRLLKLRLLHAIGLQRAGDLGAAVKEADTVLRTASEEGFVRLILEEGPAVAPLIQCYEALSREQSGALRNPILSEYVQRLLKVLGPAPEIGNGGLQEPLTRSEIRVLQLLAEGDSNTAIASKLFVSDSTVRTHLRNINVKLGAHSRTQAVANARRLGIIR
ncbi:LuxR C-terminal-related transcriptional regulator [Paraburkholderia sp. J67]|uniref:LuxR C-terminal-related transcriptional regulator n=1 Tax=Paraburkholderia sp. J67 TaxID=2805435 RepID=UPI002ABD97B1|nr:LuxR C-terminal-related transcriptional regulator [Paraburkholderia sp. J67]